MFSWYDQFRFVILLTGNSPNHLNNTIDSSTDECVLVINNKLPIDEKL